MCVCVKKYCENVATRILMWLSKNVTRKPQWLFRIDF